MRSAQAGFTLIESIVAAAISVVLLAAGGYWVLSMQPGALRAAVDDYDADLAAARAIAGSSGNGATLLFAPRLHGAPGFTLRVYSGRPNAAGAVSPTTVMAVTSATALAEAHFGKPPFALFLDTAGYPTGIATYPTLDANENPTFGAIAQQPPCPSGGIVLTFTSPQGATATRSLPCTSDVAGTAAPVATPTPNVPRISPTYLLAHDTSDAGPLKFKAAEYGYFHWYASTSSGARCRTIASDTGAAPAAFVSPWPYAAASPASQGTEAPAPPPFAPYTWPAGDPNDPPAWFTLAPVAHNGGECTVAVADDSGQSATVTVQVMGDLTASQSTLTLGSGGGSQTIDFTKTFDSETLVLSVGGPCAGIVSVVAVSGSHPATPSHTPATASVTVTPVSAGSCNLVVQDQYGERIGVGVTVTDPMASWPEQIVLGASGGSIAAARPVTAGCYAAAETSSGFADPLSTTPAFVQSFAAANGMYTDATGCFTNASGAPVPATSNTVGMIAYEPSQTNTSYQVDGAQNTCTGANASETGWLPSSSGIEATLVVQPGAIAGTCQVAVTDGATAPTIDHGLAHVTAILPCSLDSYGYCAVMLTSQTYTVTWHPVGPCPSGGIIDAYNGIPGPGGALFLATYNVYGNIGFLGIFSEGSYIESYCGGYRPGPTTWTPAPPSATYGDPNLP